MSEKAKQSDISKMSFEAALAELEDIVGSLEQGESQLDGAIKAYERGTELKKHCEAKLKAARERVEKINLGADGAVGVEAFDSE
ncbi:MAG: exodeoxyribonuclease VII small subunit [Rhodospirillales bacterium]|nr:exodeoxyribonuclease VII small subunit [Rhodospirillales bacterium]